MTEQRLETVVADLKEQLEAANRRFETLMWAIRVKDKQILEFSDAVNENHDVAQAAERKLATASWVARQLLDSLPQTRDWLDPDIEHELRALAQAEQPKLSDSDKQHVLAMIDYGYTLHEVASARMLSWIDEPNVAPFVQDFTFRRRIYSLGHELIEAALAQIEQPQEKTNVHP